MWRKRQIKSQAQSEFSKFGSKGPILFWHSKSVNNFLVWKVYRLGFWSRDIVCVGTQIMVQVQGWGPTLGFTGSILAEQTGIANYPWILYKFYHLLLVQHCCCDIKVFVPQEKLNSFPQCYSTFAHFSYYLPRWSLFLPRWSVLITIRKETIHNGFNEHYIKWITITMDSDINNNLNKQWNMTMNNDNNDNEKW